MRKRTAELEDAEFLLDIYRELTGRCEERDIEMGPFASIMIGLMFIDAIQSGVTRSQFIDFVNQVLDRAEDESEEGTTLQ